MHHVSTTSAKIMDNINNQNLDFNIEPRFQTGSQDQVINQDPPEACVKSADVML